jgi:hypothetical protein
MMRPHRPRADTKRLAQNGFMPLDPRQHPDRPCRQRETIPAGTGCFPRCIHHPQMARRWRSARLSPSSTIHSASPAAPSRRSRSRCWPRASATDSARRVKAAKRGVMMGRIFAFHRPSDRRRIALGSTPGVKSRRSVAWLGDRAGATDERL